MHAVKQLPMAAIILSIAVGGCGPGDRASVTTARPAAEVTRQTFKEFDGFVVHFNSLTTEILAPEAAMAFEITRSSSRAMINIHVRKTDGSGFGVPTSATVTVDAHNLAGQAKNLDMRPVTDQATAESPHDVIYYISDFAVTNGESIAFDVTVVPEGETKELTLSFRKQFFTR